MKIKLTTIIILFTLVATVFGGAYLEQFSASSNGDDIKLEWKTGEESGVKSFIIERSPISYDNFIEIASVKPQGSNSFYTYTDKSAYKATDLVFKYRLKIVANEITYSKTISVSQNISGVKRTWGSIKAMFR
jgi:hypothetical protein